MLISTDGTQLLNWRQKKKINLILLTMLDVWVVCTPFLESVNDVDVDDEVKMCNKLYFPAPCIS